MNRQNDTRTNLELIKMSVDSAKFQSKLNFSQVNKTFLISAPSAFPSFYSLFNTSLSSLPLSLFLSPSPFSLLLSLFLFPSPPFDANGEKYFAQNSKSRFQRFASRITLRYRNTRDVTEVPRIKYPIYLFPSEVKIIVLLFSCAKWTLCDYAQFATNLFQLRRINISAINVPIKYLFISHGETKCLGIIFRCD